MIFQSLLVSGIQITYDYSGILKLLFIYILKYLKLIKPKEILNILSRYFSHFYRSYHGKLKHHIAWEPSLSDQGVPWANFTCPKSSHPPSEALSAFLPWWSFRVLPFLGQVFLTRGVAVLGREETLQG